MSTRIVVLAALLFYLFCKHILLRSSFINSPQRTFGLSQHCTSIMRRAERSESLEDIFYDEGDPNSVSSRGIRHNQNIRQKQWDEGKRKCRLSGRRQPGRIDKNHTHSNVQTNTQSLKEFMKRDAASPVLSQSRNPGGPALPQSRNPRGRAISIGSTPEADVLQGGFITDSDDEIDEHTEDYEDSRYAFEPTNIVFEDDNCQKTNRGLCWRRTV